MTQEQRGWALWTSAAICMRRSDFIKGDVGAFVSIFGFLIFYVLSRRLAFINMFYLFLRFGPNKIDSMCIYVAS